MAASQIWPSCSSPSPTRQYTRAGTRLSRTPSAIPLATDNPCPSGPPDVSMPGRSTCEGCPCRRDPIRRNVRSSAGGKYPVRASAEYRPAHKCPLLRTKRSRSGQSGAAGSCRNSRKYSVARISAAPSAPPGCPLAATTVCAMTSRRICAAARSSGRAAYDRVLGTSVLLSLDSAGGEPGDEFPLHNHEQDDDRHRGDHTAGHQQIPADDELAHER